ncbi:echinoderm microtubule-associated protein-like 1 isoform X2 [Corticium candelabrum]|uniref:echinoderm microtubule-associated protein-like 1 isoform X2 n=1 Tax=Corticium candelabrum TaxID=121492 RepID=UPI002E25A591|nr:echinoderm microtubule-associated protein-like 1 isoform X2 [Corticium candelabrum]
MDYTRTEDRGGSGKRLFTVASVKTPSSRACGDEGQSTGKQPTSQTVMGAESTGNTISWAEKSGTPYLTSKGKRNGGAHSRRSGPVHSQPRTVSTGDNTVRLYLRGRSVVLYAPTGIDISEADQAMLAPQQKLQLEWVYGYRGKDCRSNIFVLPSGELLYFIAAVAIMYNPESGTQRHFTEHNDDIKCMAVHPNKKIVATGQVASHDKDMGKPHILIWDVETLETMAVIGVGDFERAISCLIFSAQDGEMLIAIDESNEHMMSVWDWKKKRKLQETRTTNDSVLGVAVPQSHGQLSVVSYGKQHVCFWTWVNDGKLQKKMGLFGKHDKPKFITVAVFSDNGDVITGDSNGTIYVWDCNEHRIRRAIKDAHAGAVLALTVAQNGLMISGGKDRKIIEWDEAFTKTGRNVEVPEIAGGVRAIVVLVSGQLILGTTGNMLVKGTFEAGLHEQMKGHCDELWGLAVSPINNHFVTAGNDRLVCVWDAMTHSTLWSTTLSDAAVCATFHSTGSVVCIGLQTGRWLVFDAVTGTYVSSGTDGSKEISAVKYSPDGSKLCVASHDNGIYIYSVDDNGRAYDKMGRCSGHSSFVTHVDWSCDSRNIQSVSGDYELLYCLKSVKGLTQLLVKRSIAFEVNSRKRGRSMARCHPELTKVCTKTKRSSVGDLFETGIAGRLLKMDYKMRLRKRPGF